jgi:hypothetical protein
MAVTLVLTRTPLKEFKHGAQSGRWGELVAIKGPKIASVKMSPGGDSSSDGGATIEVAHGVLQLSTTAATLGEVKHYTSMERFKTNNGKSWYVQLHPKPQPYSISFESGNSAVKELRAGHTGNCFRVHGGKPGPEQGILIHEAPHVGWLIGCISPRPLNNFNVEFPNQSGNPSYQCMNELFHFVGHTRADLFVLDW